MKKNISINISGIIFHIEEDGYDDLKNYLDSINRYFSNFEDSYEIIADIESRIAEIFLAKLKDGKQVITKEDVESLMATMGSIKDFQAADEDTSYIVSEEEEQSQEEKGQQEEAAYAQSPPKRLYRDMKRRILGGVLAGFAHYLSVDPLWIRLLFLLFFFGVIFIKAIAPGLLIAYIVLWIILPQSYDLEPEKKIRRMFRNSDDKVLGGVSSGIAAYFGVDTTLIRLLFFISIFFGGTGVILYIILWVILPEAVTLTDKMEMQGQPITLSNIEQNIKKSFQVKEGEENIWVKILLFPFRLLTRLIEFLNRVLGPLMRFLVEAARIFGGALIILIGVGLFVSLIIALGIIWGIITTSDPFYFSEFPVEIIKNDLTWYRGLAIVLSLMIPAIFISILGTIIIANRNVLNKTLAYSLLGIWLLSIAVSSITIPPVAMDFNTSGEHIETEDYALNSDVLLLTTHKAGYFNYDEVRLDIKSHGDSVARLVTEYHARGVNRQKASENAQMVNYNIAKRDSTFMFDTNLTFEKDAKFRMQDIFMTLYLPEGQKFKIDYNLNDLLGNFLRRKGFRPSDATENTWYFDQGNLVCASCPEIKEKDEPVMEFDEGGEGVTREFDFENFNEVQVSDKFKVKIRQGKDYLVTVNGPRNNLDDVVFEQRGDQLFVRNKNNRLVEEDIAINIEMPSLDYVKVEGSSAAEIAGFVENYISIDLEKASDVSIDIVAERIKAKLSGAAKLELSGSGDQLEADISDAAKLFAYGYKAKEITLEASGSSSSRIFADEYIKINSSDGSYIRYRGDARVEIDRSGSSKVRKD